MTRRDRDGDLIKPLILLINKINMSVENIAIAWGFLKEFHQTASLSICLPCADEVIKLAHYKI